MIQHEDSKRRSRWTLRAMEWDEPKAGYPNIWHDGMPCQLLLLNRVACRLRLGDLVAVYYPKSQQHQERSEKFVGLARVAGLRKAHKPGYAWTDLETAHRLRKPLAVDPGPYRVFLCCDPGWPATEVAMFRAVFDAAQAEGWRPEPGELEAVVKPEHPASGDQEIAPADSEPGKASEPAEPVVPVRPDMSVASAEPAGQPTDTPSPAGPTRAAGPARIAKPKKPSSPSLRPVAGERMFGGADYGGDMRDAKDRTWLAILGLLDDRLRVIRLTPTGRAGVQASLRDPDTSLMSAEAIGMDFPFAFPLAFAESLLEGPFPEEGWWALVRRLERMTRPAFLAAVHEFREAHGEVKRLTDEAVRSPSPLHRGKRDLSPMAYHGMRMIGEDRSRYAVRPFETAKGRLLLEVNPRVSARNLLADAGGGKNRGALIEHLKSLGYLPVDMEPPFARSCHDRTAALDAVIAARAAAVAVLTGEAEKTPEELAPGQGDRVRREGWIYGLNEPA